MTIVPDLFWNPVDIIRAHCVDVRHQRRARWQVSDFVINEMTRHFQRDVLKKESDIPTDKAEDVATILAQAFTQSHLNLLRIAKHYYTRDSVGLITGKVQAFEKVHNALEADKSIDSSLSGTTAVAGVVLGSNQDGRKIVMANAGDSRAILAYEDGGSLKVKELSEDQKPDRDDERRRILSCGGRVEPLMDENGEAIGPYRVWLPNMMLPGLAMARSIGAACLAVCLACAARFVLHSYAMCPCRVHVDACPHTQATPDLATRAPKRSSGDDIASTVGKSSDF